MREPLLDLSCHGMVDVALARAAMARVLDPECVPGEAELEFLDGASSRALREVGETGAASLVVELAEDGLALRATVRDGSGVSRWSSTLGLSKPLPEAVEGPEAPRSDLELLSAELLRTSHRAGAVAAVSGERARDLEWHQQELEETNLGVLALHAELAEASDEQRRLLAAEREARDEVEASRNRLTFLSTASARLMTSLSQTEIFSRLRDLLVPRYADSVEVWLLGENGELCSADAPGTGPSGAEPPEEVLLSAARRRPADAVAEQGRLALPLLTGTDLLGVMLLRRGSAVDPDDGVVLVEFSHRVAVSLDNARRFERERDTAAALQRAMLTELPGTPGMELTARYLPATRGMNVGGDWYDVFPLEDGEFIGVVGDVTGHGVHAAVMMGQLRTALRAYAMEERSPAALMERLHRLLGRLEPDLFATAVIVRFRPGDPEMVMAGAGHPPPLWRDGGGGARAVELPSGGMLGLPVEPSYTDHTVELPPGSALLLYTDGLVERRGESIDDGIARLLEGFGGPPYWESGPEKAADDLLDAMVKHQDCDDDVCLLVFLAGEAPDTAV
ncbi:serine phosphatase RsbU (regulator of sigma subunit) [Nocardiopsis arvandica]|uniref:Serine phosphatase RsbU (Regulator of sigma subunit) n=1 Tax=Nocardiopsis sinuspersici TaxID=501010 RepID=A0A7Z0BJW3_9ACTN|nr:PP2C family protein-serine/threonine phosphatase [Nocardiopsis sinuspersici]NYH51814.1 serine phosphatase RsbU (regulator of sigma subunit) [Nocardiopsis sinuspersici]